MLGQTLGNYRLVAEIGKGGMGVVYLAEHTLLGRKVAVKLLHSDVHQDQVERFFDEARAAATLHHPGLIEVFDFGRRDDGSAFIVMEFLSGESLAERLQKDPRLQVPLACSITRAVANALQVAHEQGIIHRDLKPGNIFLIPDAEAAFGIRTKVLDFGIAKLHRQTEPRSVRTHSGAVIGTPRYMSPEQCKNARTVDGRSDIYALGCILYEMLLGVAPFDYDTWAELVGAHLYEEPPRPHELDPSLPADVADVVVKMLEKRPEDRYESMLQLAQVLEGLLRTRVGGTDLRLTPPAGVRTSVARGAASDPTLPASGGSGPILRTSSPAIPAPAASIPIPRAASPAALDNTANAPADPLAIPRPSARRLGKLWLALGVVAVGAAATVIAIRVLGDRTPRPSEQTFVVIDDRPAASDAAAAPSDAAAASVTPPGVVDAATPHPDRPSSKTDVEQLTRTFGRRTDALRACFREHPADVGTEPLSVRIQIDVRGKVVAAEVLPAKARDTALGGCIAGVAKDTAFGPQPKPATFRVPILMNQNR